MATMRALLAVLTAVIALLHLWFMTLEMFLWETPLGLKTFHRTAAQAAESASLAANQGLYNGFLAVACSGPSSSPTCAGPCACAPSS